MIGVMGSGIVKTFLKNIFFDRQIVGNVNPIIPEVHGIKGLRWDWHGISWE
jgi:hypothetical protein